MELYREIEQKRGLRIRVLPVGSTTILKDLVNANRDAHVRQQSLARASSGHNKRPSVEITDAASSPNSTTKEKKKKKKNDDEYGDRDDKKSKKKKTEHVP